MTFQHIPASSSSDTHFIASMTQTFKARVYGCSGDKRHTLNLTSRMETCSWDPFSPDHEGLHPRKLSVPSRNGIGLPTTQKSKECFDFPHNWLDPCCSQSQTLSADLVVAFNYVFAVEKENKTLFSHISGPIISEHLSPTLCWPRLQAKYSEECFLQGWTFSRAQYLLTAYTSNESNEMVWKLPVRKLDSHQLKLAELGLWWVTTNVETATTCNATFFH